MPEGLTLYIDVGSNEWEDRSVTAADSEGNPLSYPQVYLEGTQAMLDALLSNGVPESSIKYQIDKGGIHEPSLEELHPMRAFAGKASQ